MEEPAAPSVCDSSWVAASQAVFAQPKFEKRESVSKGPDDHVFGNGKSIALTPCERFVVVFEMRTASRGVVKVEPLRPCGIRSQSAGEAFLRLLTYEELRPQTMALCYSRASRRMQIGNRWPRLRFGIHRCSKLERAVETLESLVFTA
jgi:hypothetical protein